jgi:hypothetical protein
MTILPSVLLRASNVHLEFAVSYLPGFGIAD